MPRTDAPSTGPLSRLCSRERVFEPFFTTKGTRGSGLGLSVAYGILMRFGGDLDASSRPGEGTTVTLRLPVAPPETTEQLTADDLAAGGIDQLLLKPFEISEIEATVRRVLSVR